MLGGIAGTATIGKAGRMPITAAGASDVPKPDVHLTHLEQVAVDEARRHEPRTEQLPVSAIRAPTAPQRGR